MSEFNKEVFLQNLKEVNTVLKQIHICIDNIVKLSNDMAGADSEINEAILQLQQNVIAINGTLTQHDSSINSLGTSVSNLTSTTNNLNLDKMDRPNITITGNSGTFTQEVFNKLSLDRNMYIVRNSDDGTQWFARKLAYYDNATNNLCYLYENISKYNINQDNCNIAKEQIVVDCVSKEWTYSSTSQITLYNKSQIDTLLENAGGSVFTKLWENSSPTSSMGVETINNIDFSKYKTIIIQYCVDTTASYVNISTQVIKIDNILNQNWYYTYANHFSNSGLYYRTINISTTSGTIQFAGAQTRTFANITTFTSGNNYMVPWVIYGMEE